MTDDESTGTGARPPTPLWQRALLWLITILCFAWLYTRIDAAIGLLFLRRANRELFG